MIAESIPPQQTTATDLPVRMGSARMLGIADDPRVSAHFAEQRSAIEKMRAELPAALAKEKQSLRPGAVPKGRDEKTAGPE